MLPGFYEGDCNELLKSVPNESCKLVLVDPPYGISFQSGHRDENSSFELIVNDDKPCLDWIPEAYRATKNGGSIVCFCRWDVQEAFRAALEAAGWEIKSQLVWVKSDGARGMGDLEREFASQHELAWFAIKDKDFHFEHGRPSTTLHFKSVPVNGRVHPTEKPVAMMQHIIEKLTNEGDIVLDPFAGSGPVPYAAKQTGRECYSFELDPTYAEVCRDRLSQVSVTRWF